MFNILILKKIFIRFFSFSFMVKFNSYKFISLLFVSFIFTISSCFTPIGSIVKHPKLFDQKKVKVRGKVVSSIELDDLSIFYLKNGKHTVAVITEGYLPMNNEFIHVKGRVYSNFQYHTRWKMLVIYERINIKNSRDKDAEYKYLDEKYFDSDEFP